MGRARKIIRKVESVWRHYIVYPVLRKVLRNPELKECIDIHSIRSILILRYDRIGDMIVTTPIFRNLKQANPKLYMGVFASESNAEIIQHNPYVDVTYVVHSNWMRFVREIIKARRQKYDVILDFIFNRMTSSGLLANIIAPQGLKIGQGVEKYKFYFNKLLTIERDKNHMAEFLAAMVKDVFGIRIEKEKLSFDVYNNDYERESIQQFLNKHKLIHRTIPAMQGLPYLILNLSVPEKLRKLSWIQMRVLGIFLSSFQSFKLILLTDPSDAEGGLVASELTRTLTIVQFPGNCKASLLQLAYFIKGACCVITPDTSIVHFAAAGKTPVIAFYSPIKEKNEWLPFQVKHYIVRAAENKPISSIPMSEILFAVEKFLAELGFKRMNAVPDIRED